MGQSVRVTLESSDFDPWVVLLAPNGEAIAENDNISQSNSNFLLTVTLPISGRYAITVYAYDN